MANPLKAFLFPFIAEPDVMWYGISLWIVQDICLVMSPPSPLCSLQSIHWVGRVRNRRPWWCADTVQQKLEH